MFRYSLLPIILLQPLYAFHMVDISGGTGALWSNTSGETSVLGLDKVKLETTDGVYMRETAVLGLRYSRYYPHEDGFYYVGLEASGTASRPTTDGKVKYSLVDSSGRTKNSYTEDLNSATAPSLGIVRGSLHLGFHKPIDSMWAYEFGILGGLSSGQTKTTYTYAFAANTSGSSSGPNGIGLHAALRFALQMMPVQHLVVSLEYRLTGEFFGKYAFIPILMSSGSYATASGHLVLLSVGYRFGADMQPVSAPAPENQESNQK